MKNLKIMMMTLVMCLIGFTAMSQWTYKMIDNNFDEPFKRAYVYDSDNRGYIILEEGLPLPMDTTFENMVNVPYIRIMGTYFCDDVAAIDMTLVVKGINKKYILYGSKSEKNIYEVSAANWTVDMIKDFKIASKCYLRVNQEYCDNDIYEFNMAGSTAAFNFITK